MAGGGKGGGKGHASNAALDDNEDVTRRRVAFGKWKAKKRPHQMIDYAKSPPPPRRTT